MFRHERRARRDQPARAPRPATPSSPAPAIRSRRSATLLAESRIELPPGLPPMSAGVFGYLGYDMVRRMERLAPAKPDPIGVPEALLIRPTVMVVFDAARDEMAVVTPVRPAPGVSARAAHESAQARLDAVVAALEAPLDHARRRRGRPDAQGGRGPLQHDRGRIPGDGREGEGLHRRRRRLPDRAVAALHQPLRSAGLFALSGAAAGQSLALSLLSRFRRLPDRRVEPGDPGPGARRQGRHPADRRHAAARRDARARTRRWPPSCSPTRRSAPST